MVEVTRNYKLIVFGMFRVSFALLMDHHSNLWRGPMVLSVLHAIFDFYNSVVCGRIPVQAA